MSVKQDVIAVFNENFTTTPRVFYSPGRINLIGEHIDYLGGNVLPANISLYMLGMFSKND